MTVIAYRDGVLAADTLSTTDSGIKSQCVKLYRTNDGGVLGTAGDDSPCLMLLDALNGDEAMTDALRGATADIVCLLMNHKGVFKIDKWCRPEKVEDEFIAVGSGAQAALGAMHQGATAEESAYVACKVNAFCGLPIQTMSLENSDG
jgi:ATP-dependent HslUV protease subunit HslV